MLDKLAPSKFDNFFKALLNDDWCDETSGNVEAPCGFYGLLRVPSDIPQDGAAAEFWQHAEREYFLSFHDVLTETPESGWYILILNDQGIIFAYLHDNQQSAKAHLDELHMEYMRWEDGDPDEL